MNRRIKPALLLTIISLLSTLPALAQTRVWVGTVDTVWTNSANWQNAILPVADAPVLIQAGTPHNARIPAGTWPETGRYGTFTVEENATAICLGSTNAVNEASGGTTNNPHGIGVTIRCADAYIDGTLSADSQGFPIMKGPGYIAGNTTTPASHGGRLHLRGTGDVYGNAISPTALGSGGGATAGGGAIALDATGLIRVNGTLTANANDAGRGTGSGGSISLQCDDFAGAVTGRIRAEAGHGSINASGNGSAGGGGRVAIVYNASTYAGRISVRGGNTGTDWRAQPGTLWEPGRYAGAAGNPEAPVNVLIQDSFQYVWPDAAVTNYWNLTVSNAWFEVHDGALAIGDLTLEDWAYFRSDNYAYKAYNYGGGFARTMGYLSVTGAMTVRGGSHLYLPAWTYDLDTLTVEAGSTLYPVGDPTLVNAASGGSEETPHGAGPVIRANSAVVDGSINGKGLGFPAFQGPASRAAGNFSGSHGGQGSDPVFYGRMTHPTALGSGGGRAITHSGGSALHLEVRGELTLNGDIDVSGIGHVSYIGLDAGAGGSIRLAAHTLKGGGSLLAGFPSTRVFGGGRIALGVVDAANWTGDVSVQVLTDSNSSDGTIFFCQSVDLDSTIEANTTGGATITTTLDVDRQGARLDRNITAWRPSGTTRWTDTSTDAETGDPLSNMATYTLAGLTPDGKYTVLVNDVQRVDITRADSAGAMVIDDVAIDHAVTVQVLGPRGSLITVR